MASNDQLRNSRVGQGAPHVALSDLPIVGCAIGGARGSVAAANGTTVLISKQGQNGAAKGTGVSSVASLILASLRVHVNGPTAWTAGQLQIQDTAGNAIITFPASVLTANGLAAATSAGVTYTSLYYNGATVGEGLQAVVTGYSAGSPLVIVGFASAAS